jgi:hypothetical protein
MHYVFEKTVDAQRVRDFMVEQGIVGHYTSRVAEYDRSRDPICVLELTIEDEAKAIYFKMWFEPSREKVKNK